MASAISGRAICHAIQEVDEGRGPGPSPEVLEDLEEVDSESRNIIEALLAAARPGLAENYNVPVLSKSVMDGVNELLGFDKDEECEDED